MKLSDEQYDRVAQVIDQVKTDDRQLDTDEYVAMIEQALGGETYQVGNPDPTPEPLDSDDYCGAEHPGGALCTLSLIHI